MTTSKGVPISDFEQDGLTLRLSRFVSGDPAVIPSALRVKIGMQGVRAVL
jgi:hypothetical protein